MKRLTVRAAGVTLVLGLGCFASIVNADDDPARSDRSEIRRIRVVERGTAKNWIGVHAIPVDDALKSHLELEERLIVHSVIPDSPASKGGLRQHDILITFGDREVKKLKDLLDAVAASDRQHVKVVVLRGGKKTTLEVQPTERPANLKVSLPEDFDLRVTLDGFLGGRDGGRLRVVGPGLFEDLPALPGNLSINVTKENDEPAKIVVKRDDDTWEITEDDIDELPEDIRKHVRRHLDHSGERGTGPSFLVPAEDGTLRVFGDFIPRGVDEKLRKQMERAIEQLERVQKRFSSEDPFKELREEMKSLRREVEKLRERDQSTTPPAADARDA